MTIFCNNCVGYLDRTSNGEAATPIHQSMSTVKETITRMAKKTNDFKFVSSGCEKGNKEATLTRILKVK